MRIKVFEKAQNLTDDRLKVNETYTLCFWISNNRIFISYAENVLYSYDLKYNKIDKDDEDIEFLNAWELKRSFNSIIDEIFRKTFNP